MNKKLPVSEFAKILPQILEECETVSFCPKGRSMLPTIREGDTVTFVKPGKLSRYDILLYVDESGKAILHRLIGFRKDGSYVMRGDSQSVKEFGIIDKNIVAKVISVTKNGKTKKTVGFWFKVRSFILLHLKYIKRILIK